MKQLIIIFIIGITACTVIESPEEGIEAITFQNIFPTSQSETSSILNSTSNGTWKITGFEMESINGFQSCRMDDLITLKNDGTYDYDGGTKLCGAEDDQLIKSGTWILDYPSRVIIIDQGTENEFSLYIESLTENEAIFSTSYLGLDILGRFQKN
ncbi:lipocalin family protein [Reichenbachiella versicolor]|uniref:lipocalin family protein n=1 Tax=Reichenbachiella versicolor TaxID=1821036 RepID=UPI000D6E14ED|nr:lipocalin family protein [Reichenbachiella versicolor]